VTRLVFIERDKCVGCYACVVACKLEHNLPPHPVNPPRPDQTAPAFIRVAEVGPDVSGEAVYQYFQPVMCRHCLPAPCVEACSVAALYKDPETKITMVKRDQCTGCQLCLAVCPWKVPRFYDGKVMLCNLCGHREDRERGRRTACEAACPAGVIHTGTAQEIAAWKERKAAERVDRL